MIKATFYPNGFEIDGHARPDICSEVSIFIWGQSMIVTNTDETAKFYTSHEDDSNAGYGFLTYNADNELSVKIAHLTKEMLRLWADKYRWQEDGHMKITEKDETLVTPPNFKVLKGIETTALPSPKGGSR